MADIVRSNIFQTVFLAAFFFTTSPTLTTRSLAEEPATKSPFQRISRSESALFYELFPNIKFKDCAAAKIEKAKCLEKQLELSFYAWAFLYFVKEFPFTERIRKGDFSRFKVALDASKLPNDYEVSRKQFFGQKYRFLSNCLRHECSNFLLGNTERFDEAAATWDSANTLIECILMNWQVPGDRISGREFGRFLYAIKNSEQKHCHRISDAGFELISKTTR